MKMWKSFLLTAVVCAFSFQVSGAEKVAKHTQEEYAAAYELLEALQVPVQLKQTLDGLVEMQMRANPKLVPYKSIFTDFFNKYMSFEALKKGYADIYLDSFSAAELKELTAFYKSPVGKKLASKTAEFALRGAALGQKAVQDHQLELQTALAKAISERQGK